MSSVGDPSRPASRAANMNGVWGFWVYSDVTEFEIGAAALPVGKGTNKPVIFTDPWDDRARDQTSARILGIHENAGRSQAWGQELHGVDRQSRRAAELLPGWYEWASGMPWLAGTVERIDRRLHEARLRIGHHLLSASARDGEHGRTRTPSSSINPLRRRLCQRSNRSWMIFRATVRKQFGM